MSTPEQRPETGSNSEPQRDNRPSLWQSFWRRIRRNLGLKILSFLIAIGLWTFVNAGQRSALETMQVPISYHSLPAGLAIVNHPVDFVNIQVMGPRTLLSLLDAERLAVKLDLSSIGQGQASFKITPAMFDVPRQTSVTSVSPSQVILDIDKIVRRDVPVRLDVQGSVADGYMVQSVHALPKTVRVIGPSRFVDALKQVESRPIDLANATTTINRTVNLETPRGPDIVLSTVKILAQVNIAQKVVDREFRNVSFEVKGSGYNYEIEPKTGAVTLRGPQLKLAQVKSNGLLFVEAKDLAPGLHFVPVQVNVPDGMKLVHQSVSKVKLILSSKKNSSGTGEGG